MPRGAGMRGRLGRGQVGFGRIMEGVMLGLLGYRMSYANRSSISRHGSVEVLKVWDRGKKVLYKKNVNYFLFYFQKINNLLIIGNCIYCNKFNVDSITQSIFLFFIELFLHKNEVNNIGTICFILILII